MKRNGFTLIELLGVIIILALLTILVFPSIVNLVKNSSNKTDALTLDLIYNATELYMSDYKSDYSEKEGFQYAIYLDTLVEEGLLTSPIKLSDSDEDLTEKKCVQVTYQDGFKYELIDNDDCYEFHIEEPDLYNNTLTPVVYDTTLNKWKIVSSTSEDWYDYENQKWANAVVLNSGSTKTVNDTIEVDGTNKDITAMFVWIPRFEYKIISGTESVPTEVGIRFKSERTTRPSKDYTISPAFTFGEGNELSGVWVGKFEISHATKTSTLNCKDTDCSNADGIRVLPNVKSLKSNTVSSFFYAIRSMTRSGNPFGFNSRVIDSHMTKDSEWGAVAYLSQSIYGKYGNSDYEGVNKAVYQNKSSDHITGSSNGTPSQTETNTQCTYDDTTNNCGIGASTTGNIYGIYDMSGGAFDYVMRIYKNSSGEVSVGNEDFNSGFSGKLWPNGVDYDGALIPEEKYYDLTTGTVAYEGNPWKARGGATGNNANGIFSTTSIYGYASISYTTRIALTNPGN